MTRITNLVARKRKYAPDVPAAPKEGETALWPSSSTHATGHGSQKHGKAKSSYSKGAGGAVRGPKGTVTL